MSTVQTERVLVVPTELFHRLGYFQGFTRNVERYVDELFRPQNTSYRPRGEMEGDPGFKQLIPYVIFRSTDAADGTSLFQYTRGVGQGEQRLHRKLSIGVGGHICSADASGDDTDPYEEGMQRELAEEVFIDTSYRSQCVGLINDDQTEVGQVHLGVVHIFDVEQPKVLPREPDILDAGFRPVAEMQSRLDEMESWSRICFAAIL